MRTLLHLLAALPRLMAGVVLIFIPIAVIGYALYFLIPFPFAGLIAVGAGLYLFEETPYGSFIKRILPF